MIFTTDYANNRFTHAIVRPPSESFHLGLTEANLGAPDYGKALEQHAVYCAALQECGLELAALPPVDEFPDACFVEDTAIVIDDTVAITRIGATSRRGEESAVANFLGARKKLAYIEEPGTLDGGDVMRVGDHFYIGLSKRTNQPGAKQLASIVESCGKTASTIPVADFIHLKTFMSTVDRSTVIGLQKYFPGVLRAFTPLFVPEREHWAANCVSANGFVVIPADCPETEAILQKHGQEVLTVDVCEFQKMDGRLTCLSILF